MNDIVDRQTRSRMMSGIRSKNTRIELRIRKALFAKGFRYRINDSRFPGKPDMILPRHRAAVFVHGCFWHGHECVLFRIPATNSEYWRSKIQSNRTRDEKVCRQLNGLGWRIAIVWECALRGPWRTSDSDLICKLASWLRDSPEELTMIIKGTPPDP